MMMTTTRRTSVVLDRVARYAVVFFVLTGASLGCRKSTTSDDSGQIGAAVGEVMSGLDESTQGSASARLFPGGPMLRAPEQLKGPWWRRLLGGVVPRAYAASCLTAMFGACDAGVRTKMFDSCSVGAATLDGSVSLSFTKNALCVVTAAGDAVTRTATFTLTGLYGGSLAVTSPGGGQTVTRTATGFEYSVAGMERVLTGPGGHVLFDVSTQTTTPLEVTGSSRADLVIVSGALEVTHHLAGYAVTLTPNNLAWSASCNCAVSGTLTGTVSGGRADGKSASITLTGCGEADVTIDGQTDSVTLDRCVGI
jgi:hypothetical protein